MGFISTAEGIFCILRYSLQAAVLDLRSDLCDELVHFHRGGLALAITDGDVAGLGFLGAQDQHIRHAVHLLCGAELVADLLVVVSVRCV